MVQVVECKPESPDKEEPVSVLEEPHAVNLTPVLPPSSVENYAARARPLMPRPNRLTILFDDKGISGEVKMSRKESRRRASPACIAGVLVSLPNLSALCDRKKL